MGSCRAVSLPNHTFTGQAWSSKRLTSIVHILLPETDNCPSWISRGERMTVENISWSISTKECCRPWRGLNPRPPGLQPVGGDVVWRISRWPPWWWPSWILEWNDFSNSESLCCSDASHQVSAQSDFGGDVVWRISRWPKATMAAILDIGMDRFCEITRLSDPGAGPFLTQRM